jgi:hypothetical protein
VKRPLVLLVAVVLAGAGAAACARQSGGPVERLTAAARHCGFEDPRFTLRDGAYQLNETEVSGMPNPPLSPQQRRNWDRIRLVRTSWMPCLQQAAKAMGLRVTYEKMVIVN